MLIKKFVRLKYLFAVLGCLGAISMWPVRGQVLPGASPALAPTGIPTPNTDAGLQALPQTPDLVPTPTPAENVARLPHQSLAIRPVDREIRGAAQTTVTGWTAIR
jgi:hypothetical protein